MTSKKIIYVLSDLKRVGPTNQTFNIINYSNYKRESVIITLFAEPKDSLKDKFEKNKIEIISLNLSRKLYFIQKHRLQKKLKELNPKIIHSYGIKADYICSKISKNKKWQHIITLRNFPKDDILTRMNKLAGYIAFQVHTYALFKCNTVVCCSKTIKKLMENRYPSKNFLCIQNGVDTKIYKPVEIKQKQQLRIKYGFKNKQNIFICTNSFIPRKRIEDTIDLYDLIDEKNKIMLFLGDGILWKNIVEKYNDRSDILFVGKSDKIKDYLNLSDYFISTSESEGLPNSVLEAIASGIPVILSNINQHMEIINEIGNIGITYQLNNINSIKTKYLKINSKEYNEMKLNTKLIVNSNFTMENMSKKYVKLYAKIGDLDE